MFLHVTLTNHIVFFFKFYILFQQVLAVERRLIKAFDAETLDSCYAPLQIELTEQIQILLIH